MHEKQMLGPGTPLPVTKVLKSTGVKFFKLAM